MCCAKRVVFALAAFGKSRQASASAQGADAVTASGEDLMRIALMADIPDQPVVRRVENIMDSGSQLDNAKSSAQMAAGDGNCRNGFGTQLVGKLAKLRRCKIAKVRGHFNRIK